jgi:hypothetical protein
LNRCAGLLSDFELNRPACLLLNDCGAVSNTAAGANITDLSLHRWKSIRSVTGCTQMRGVHLIDGAGHWVEQEQPEEVSRLLVQFLRSAA